MLAKAPALALTAKHARSEPGRAGAHNVRRRARATAAPARRAPGYQYVVPCTAALTAARSAGPASGTSAKDGKWLTSTMQWSPARRARARPKRRPGVRGAGPPLAPQS